MSSWVLWLFLILGVLGGVGTVMRLVSPDTAPIRNDYSAAQSLAEQVTRVYLTYNGISINERTDQLQSFNLSLDSIQQMNKLLPPEKTTQVVEQIKALEPEKLEDSRLVIPVDAWLEVKKNDQLVKRHLLVKVIIFKDSNGHLAVDGIPSILPSPEKAKLEQSSGDSISEQDKKLIEPVIKAFLADYYAAKDPVTLKNFLAEGVTVQPLSGFLEFKAITLMSVKNKPVSTVDRYYADVVVETQDPILQNIIYSRVMIELEKKEGKFYISNIK